LICYNAYIKSSQLSLEHWNYHFSFGYIFDNVQRPLLFSQITTFNEYIQEITSVSNQSSMFKWASNQASVLSNDHSNNQSKQVWKQASVHNKSSPSKHTISNSSKYLQASKISHNTSEPAISVINSSEKFFKPDLYNIRAWLQSKQGNMVKHIQLSQILHNLMLSLANDMVQISKTTLTDIQVHIQHAHEMIEFLQLESQL